MPSPLGGYGNIMPGLPGRPNFSQREMPQAVGDVSSYITAGVPGTKQDLSVSSPYRYTPNMRAGYFPQLAKSLRTPIKGWPFPPPVQPPPPAPPAPPPPQGSGTNRNYPWTLSAPYPISPNWGIPGFGPESAMLGRGLRTPIQGYQPWMGRAPSTPGPSPGPSQLPTGAFTNPDLPGNFSEGILGQIPSTIYSAFNSLAGRGGKGAPGIGNLDPAAMGDVSSAISGISGSQAGNYGRSLGRFGL